MHGGDDQDRDRLVRDTLHRAGDFGEPSLDRLSAAMPGLVDEAKRRRDARKRPSPLPLVDLIDQLVPLAWRALPGLATATVLLVALSWAALLTNGVETTETTDSIDLDRVILAGGSDGETIHPLVESWLKGDNDDG